MKTKIIDTSKLEKQKPLIKKLKITTTILLNIIVFGLLSNHRSEPLYKSVGLPNYLFVALILITASLLIFLLITYINKPTLGLLLFYDSQLEFQLKKEKIKLNISELSKLNIYIKKSKYFIEVVTNNYNKLFEIDIVFISEKKTINEFYQRWKAQGFKVELINEKEIQFQKLLNVSNKITAEESSISEPTNSNTNSLLEYDFTKYKSKVCLEFLYKIKCEIPIIKSTKKELFVLAYESIKMLNWKLKTVDFDIIGANTEITYQNHGNYILIRFNDDYMTIICKDNSSLITIGGKTNIKELLLMMSTLSKKFDPELLKLRFDEMFHPSALS